MTSLTTTMTTAPAVQYKQVLRREVLTVDRLIQMLFESGILHPSQIEELRKIQADFNTMENLGNDEKAIFLFYIVYHVLYPSLDGASDDHIDRLLKFENEAKALLRRLLPEGVDLEKYLTQLSNEEEAIKRLLLIEEFFQKQIDFLNQSARKVNQKMREKFESIKKRLIDLSKQAGTSQNQVNLRVQNLTQRIQVLLDHSQPLTKETLSTLKSFQTYQESMKNSKKPKVFK